MPAGAGRPYDTTNQGCARKPDWEARMPGDNIEVAQKCGVCGTEVGTLSVKKENLMLTSSHTVWCPRCEANTPEVRDIAGRATALETELASLPMSSEG